MELTAELCGTDPGVAQLYASYHRVTGDARAAATLVLAQVFRNFGRLDRDVGSAGESFLNSPYVRVQVSPVEAAAGSTLSTPALPLASQISVDASPPSPPPGGPLTVRQAAERLGVNNRTVYALCQSGAIAHHRIGNGRGTIRITQSDLGRYLGRQRVEHRALEAAEDHLFGPA